MKCRSLVVVSALAVFAGHAAVRGNDLPKLTAVFLKQPDESAAKLVVDKQNGTLVVTGAGGETSGHMDDGTFVGFETGALNFTFIGRIAEAGTIVPGTRIGIVARDGVAPNAKSVSLRLEGTLDAARVQWRMRYHVVANTHQGSKRAFIDGTVPDINALEKSGLWLKMVRRYPYIDLATSKDGQTWETIPYRSMLQAGKIWVGVQVVGGGDAKTPITATFDHLSFTVDKGPGASSDTPAAFQEYTSPPRKDKIVFAKVNLGTDAKPAYGTAFAIIPEGLAAKAIRAYWWTPGNKEITLADGTSMPFRRDGPKSAGGLRLPADFEKDEGIYYTDKLSPIHAHLAHHGIIRLGTLHDAFDDSVKRLAEVSGIPELKNLPFVSTGASATGGRASMVARKYPDRAVASSPTLLGAAGVEEVAKYPHLPFLHIVGSKDGPHLQQIIDAAAPERAAHALWGSAPMWLVYHHTHKQRALMEPFFIECLRLRLPANHDFAAGPAKLKTLKEEDGYLGFIETWESNFPKVVAFREFKGDIKKTVWLPTPLVARTWQAFVSYDPKTIIQFPMFEGDGGTGHPLPNGWRQSIMTADEPFEIAASGPLSSGSRGKDVKVTFYADLEPLKAKTHGDNPYRVTAAGLPPGLHVIYAITNVDGQEEISRPVTVMFHSRGGKN